LRPLALAVVVATSLLAPAGLPAQAAEGEIDATLTAPPAPPAPTTVTVSRASASAFKSVSIVDFAYDPSTLSVKIGDTVTWTNLGTAEEGHNVIGDGLESPVLLTGGTYSATFIESGTFSYICSIHPDMKGSVEVLGRSSGSSGKKKKNNNDNDKNNKSSKGSGGDGAGDSSSGSGSESGVVSAPDPAGSSGSLPATGGDSLPLTTLGLVFLNVGLALRLVVAGRARRRRG
jgi:plastocyanin